jgi:hypothetical protein
VDVAIRGRPLAASKAQADVTVESIAGQCLRRRRMSSGSRTAAHRIPETMGSILSRNEPSDTPGTIQGRLSFD